MKAQEIICDARTEWSLRWTTLLAVGYAVFFYAPPTVGRIPVDWTLPVQLITGGELTFYNHGWVYFFGIGCVVAMMMAFLLLSVVLDFLRNDELAEAYVVLLTLLTALLALPVLSSTLIGSLNNLNAIFLLLIVIFVEVMYGPTLNFAPLLEDHSDLWEQIFEPNVVAALFFVVFSVAVFAIPPWHSATHQAFGLISSVLSDLASIVEKSADQLGQMEKLADAESETARRTMTDFLHGQYTAILQMTNSAGLKIPVSLYGEQGLYQWHAFYPLACLGRNQPHRLGRTLDQTAFHTALLMFVLANDKLLDGMRHDAVLLEGVIDVLRAASSVLQACAVAIQRDRCSWSTCQKDGEDDDWRDGAGLWLFANSSADNDAGTTDARKRLETSLDELESKMSALLQAPSGACTAVVCAACRDYASGTPKQLDDMNPVISSNNNHGTLGSMAATIAQTQASYYNTNSSMLLGGLLRILYRFSFLEAIQVLVIKSLTEGCREIKMLSGRGNNQSFLERRALRRAVQYLVGMWSLYAMATWWDSYSSLLGSSSTGQWTMVAFFVCFRATAEETVNAAILRSIGHSLGALLSWGINTAVETNGGRMACHLVVSLVVTWFIPPPFVYPSCITFRLDGFLADTLQGLGTTYNLTSVLVFQTSIESAAKARALSQCIGALAAAVICVAILPWFGEKRARRTVASYFQEEFYRAENLGKSDQASITLESVDELLAARRDFGGAQDAKGWLRSLLSVFTGTGQEADRSTTILRRELDSAAIAAYAWLAMNEHCKNLLAKDDEGVITELRNSLASADYDAALSLVWDAITVCADDKREAKDELCYMYLDISILRDCATANG